MFKLVKIKNSSTNVPEPEIFNIDGVTEHLPGAVYYIVGDRLSLSSTSDNDTKVIPLEHIPENSGKKTLRGYFITEDMVFETPVSGDLNNITVGKYVDCNVDAATNIIGVTNYTGTFAMILNKDAAKSEQKVLVALKF